MKIQYIIFGVVLAGVIIMSFLVLGGKADAPADEPEPKTVAGNVHQLPDLKVTYQLDSSLQELYDIQVTSQTKTGGAENDAVIVAGKACNTMRGNFVIIGADEQTDKIVIKTLQDGRQVLEAPIVSTLMACLDTQDPKQDDTALSKALNAIGTSIESYQ